MKETFIQGIDVQEVTKRKSQPEQVKATRDPGMADSWPLTQETRGKPQPHRAAPDPQQAGERPKDAKEPRLDGNENKSPFAPVNDPETPKAKQSAQAPNQSKEPHSRPENDDEYLEYLRREIFGTYEPWRPGKKTIKVHGDYEFIDTPQETERKRVELREKIPQEERERLRDILQRFNSPWQELTDEEWNVLMLGKYRNVPMYFGSMDEAEKQELGGFRKDRLFGELDRRLKKYWTEMLTDRYPDWWKVYDKNGNRVWKMSPMDKALLAKWQRIDSLPPDEKLAYLQEAMREMTQERPWNKESAGAEVVKYLIALIFALFGIDVLEEEAKSNQSPAKAA